ncbi:hypothetical protein GZS04_17050 [Citrobacter freundii]|uniref:hypothetical protein n=1 Tax=Citrobacter freundii TaxID=546 RepID=UPI0013983F58|nr:hypothetical protein [Citrobacter freundii]QHX03667.1 hypothetical protein GZS04_17050 [Citrobacter freundii]
MRELTNSAKLMDILNINGNLLPITVESLPSEQQKFALLSDIMTKVMSIIAESNIPSHSLDPKEYLFTDFNEAYENARASGEKKNILFFMKNVYSDIFNKNHLNEDRITLHLITLDSIKMNNLTSIEMKSALVTQIKISSKEKAEETYSIFDESLKQTVVLSFLIITFIAELIKSYSTAIYNSVYITKH